ncbi:MAG: homing endonuclease associated repeat-containing protein [Lactobacillus helveticus]
MGYPPHASDYERSATVRNHFGSWQNALKSAGIKATFDSKNSRVTKEEVIFKIKKYIQAHGRIPMYNEYKNMGISYMTIQHYFGSNENAANYFKVLTFNQKISSQKIKIIKEGIQTLINTNKEINIANLSKVINLAIDKIRNDLETYFRQNNVRSKSIDKFCIAIGIDLDKYNWHLVLLEYDNFKKKHHRIPNVTQLSSVSYAKILQKYDSYRDFCIAIGDGDEYLREKYDLLTNEQLLFDLKVVANRLGRTPTIKDYYKCKKINRQTTYIKRFGSWTNGLSAAGLKLKDSQKNLIKHQEKMSNK